jgi:AcrR family transcriptional regulator
LGYHSAGVSDIIESAGVARGTFYNYFESKREVFSAVLAQLMETVIESVVAIDTTQPIPPQVTANVHNIVRSLLSMGDGARILFTDAAGIDAEGHAALREFYGGATERIARALRTGQILGVVRAGNVQITALCLLGMLKEPVYQSLLSGEGLDETALVDEILSILGGGVLAR